LEGISVTLSKRRVGKGAPLSLSKGARSAVLRLAAQKQDE